MTESEIHALIMVFCDFKCFFESGKHKNYETQILHYTYLQHMPTNCQHYCILVIGEGKYTVNANAYLRVKANVQNPHSPAKAGTTYLEVDNTPSQSTQTYYAYFHLNKFFSSAFNLFSI